MRKLILLLLFSTTALPAPAPLQREDTTTGGGSQRAPHLASMLRDRAGDRLARIVVLRPSAGNQLSGKVQLYEWESGASDLLVTAAPDKPADYDLDVDVAGGTFALTRKAMRARSNAVSPNDGSIDGGGQEYFIQGVVSASTPDGYRAGGIIFYAQWYTCPSGLMGNLFFGGDCAQGTATGQNFGDFLILTDCRKNSPGFAVSAPPSQLYLGNIRAQYDGFRYHPFGNTALHETLEAEGWAISGERAFIRWSAAHSDPEHALWPLLSRASTAGSLGTSYDSCPGESTGGGTGGGSTPNPTPDPGTGGDGGGTGGGGGGGDGTACVTIYDGATHAALGTCCGTTVAIIDCASNM